MFVQGSKGYAYNTMISGFGRVSDDALMSKVTIASGGFFHLWLGGTLKDVDVQYGGFLDIREESSILSGTVSLAGQLQVSFDHHTDFSAAAITIDLSKRSTNDNYSIVNLNYIDKTTLSITISASQATGTYKIASNASEFTGSITICNPTTCFGTLTVNGTALVYGGKTYSLVQNSGNLQLVISSGSSSSGSQVQVYSSGTLVKLGTVLTGETIVSGSNNSMHISSGGTANSTTLKTGAVMFVSSGGIANHTDISGSRVYVSGGKTVSSIIRSGGLEDVFPNGISEDAIVLNGGQLWLAGGSSINASVSSGGALAVRPNHITRDLSYAINTEIFNSGFMDVYDSSIASGTVIHKGGYVRIRDYASAINTLIESGASMFVHSSKGYAYNTMISGFGRVYDGALMSKVTIASGGIFHLWRGGILKDVDVQYGGELDIREDSSILSGTVSLAGQLKVSFDHHTDFSAAAITIDLSKRSTNDDYSIVNLNYIDKTTLSITISASQATGTYKIASNASEFTGSITICNPTTCFGTLTVNGTALSYGGKTYSLVQSSGNLQLVISSGTSSPPVVSSGGSQVKVYSSGTLVKQGNVLTGETIVAGSNNSMYVSNGGTANSTTLNTNGKMFVFRGGVANYTVINVDGYEYLYGGTDNRATVNGGVLSVSSGGVANYTTVNHSGGSSGCIDVYSGTVNSATVNSGTCFARSSGAVVNDTVINNRGYVYVGNGAVANDTFVNSGGSVYAYSSGTVNNIGVNYGGFLQYNSTSILSGSHIYGGTVSAFGKVNAVSADVTFDVSRRSTTDGYIISNLSYFDARSFSITVTANQSAGTYKLAQGASSFNKTVSICNPTTCFGTLTVNGTALTYGGMTYSLVQNSGNLQLVISSGTSSPPVVSSGGSQVKVYSSGTLVRQGTVLTGETIVSGNNNSMFVSSGGTASNTTVRNGGVVTVYGDGYAKDLVVSSGGYILAEGREDAENYEAFYASASNVTVSSGGSADFIGTDVYNLRVSSGGSAYVTGVPDVAAVDVYANLYDTEIKSGGSFEIGWSGVNLWGSTVFGGTVTVSGWADVLGKLVFNLTERTAADSYIVDDLSGLYLSSNGDSCSISISANQAAGTYKLAQGASSFNKTVSICNPTTCFGTLTVNGTALTYDGRAYTLVQNNGDLTLTIGTGNDPEPPEVIIPEYKWSVVGNFKSGGGVIKMNRDGAWIIYNASGRSLIDGDIPPSWYLLGAGDFDKDGYDGLLWQERDTGYVYMQNDLSDFDELINKTNCLGVVGPGYQILAVGDFTGTGIAGALLQGPAFGDASVSLNYGLPIWGREADGTTFNGWLGALVNTWQPGDALKGDTADLADINAKNYMYEVVSVGDYNGDGVDDVMLQNIMPKTVNGVTITGSGDVFTFLTGDINAVKAGASPTVAYAGCATDGWKIVGSGDFDGDGVDDVLLSDGAGIAGWKMANGQRIADQWFGSLTENQEIAGIADLDNDGTDDVLILDTATEFYSGWLIRNGAISGTIAIA